MKEFQPVEVNNYIPMDAFRELPEVLPHEIGSAATSFSSEVSFVIAHGVMDGQRFEAHVVITMDEDDFLMG